LEWHEKTQALIVHMSLGRARCARCGPPNGPHTHRNLL
jgi:hypothetical protein